MIKWNICFSYHILERKCVQFSYLEINHFQIISKCFSNGNYKFLNIFNVFETVLSEVIAIIFYHKFFTKFLRIFFILIFLSLVNFTFKFCSISVQVVHIRDIYFVTLHFTTITDGKYRKENVCTINCLHIYNRWKLHSKWTIIHVLVNSLYEYFVIIWNRKMNKVFVFFQISKPQ